DSSTHRSSLLPAHSGSTRTPGTTRRPGAASAEPSPPTQRDPPPSHGPGGPPRPDRRPSCEPARSSGSHGLHPGYGRGGCDIPRPRGGRWGGPGVCRPGLLEDLDGDPAVLGRVLLALFVLDGLPAPVRGL